MLGLLLEEVEARYRVCASMASGYVMGMEIVSLIWRAHGVRRE